MAAFGPRGRAAGTYCRVTNHPCLKGEYVDKTPQDVEITADLNALMMLNHVQKEGVSFINSRHGTRGRRIDFSCTALVRTKKRKSRNTTHVKTLSLPPPPPPSTCTVHLAH